MNIFSKIAVFILLIVGLTIYSCKKKQKYPNEPIIEYKGFERFGNDSAHFIISFTDGDGDIGLTQADTAAPYLSNFFTKYYQKKNGVFIEKVLGFPLNFRIPILNSGKKSKSLEGEIVIKFSAPFYYPTTTKDTILYEVYIVDRALNQSNSVRSDEIIVP